MRVSKGEYLQAKATFWTPVLIAMGAIVLIHLLPKPMTPNSSARMLMTAGYFAALVLGLVWCLGPRERYMASAYGWRYAEANEGLRKAWQGYLFSLNSTTRVIVCVALLFVVGAGIEVLSAWWLGLAPLAPTARWARIIGLLALICLPFYFGGRISETLQRRRLVHELRATSEFKPGQTGPMEPTGAAVEVTGAGQFRAGGFEWSLEDFYKSVMVFGQSGTGKTVCVLNALLDGVLASTATSRHREDTRPAMLILDPKGDFLTKIESLCDRHGRADDLRVLDPQQGGRSIRWNPFDTDDDELQLAMRFAATMEALGQKSDKDTFFVDAARTFMRHAIRLARLTNNGEPPSLVDVSQTASNLGNVARRAARLDAASMTLDDDATLDYFVDNWTGMASETRSSIVATLSNMIDPFLMEPYRSVFTGRSTERIATMVERGRILYVHMPIAEREAMARMVCTMVKLEFFREVLRRPNKPRPSVFFCDEFQCFLTTAKGIGDSDFFERSRQSNHANIVATQNVSSLLKYAEKREPVDNLLGNCAVKIFLRNTEEATNRYAAELFGRELQGVGGVGVSDANMGRRKQGPGANIGYQEGYRVRPEAFPELRVPARGSSNHCESIVHLASRAAVARRRLTWRVHPL